MFQRVSSNSCPLNLLLVGCHQAEIIIVKCFIQGHNNANRLWVEPRSRSQGRLTNYAFTLWSRRWRNNLGLRNQAFLNHFDLFEWLWSLRQRQYLDSRWQKVRMDELHNLKNTTFCLPSVGVILVFQKSFTGGNHEKSKSKRSKSYSVFNNIVVRKDDWWTDSPNYSSESLNNYMHILTVTNVTYNTFLFCVFYFRRISEVTQIIFCDINYALIKLNCPMMGN